jgi:hypothetical protein
MQSSARLSGSFRHSGIFCIPIEHWDQSNKLSECRLRQVKPIKTSVLVRKLKLREGKQVSNPIQTEVAVS